MSGVSVREAELHVLRCRADIAKWEERRVHHSARLKECMRTLKELRAVLADAHDMADKARIAAAKT